MLKLDDSSKELAGKALAAAITAVFAGTNVAYAQNADDSSGDQGEGPMEEVIVTATKRAESIQDVPMSITAFTDETIVQQGFKRLGDYAGQIPGLAFAVREPGGSTVLMRGCVTSGIAFSDSTTTSIYLDEQPITAGGFNPDPRLIDIERVEALSGPQATLLGDSSMCGSLRIITNKPDLNEFSSWADVGFHTIDDGDDGYEVSGMVNIPLIEDKLALRLVGFTGEDAGYIDNVFGLSAGGTFDNAAMVSDDVNTSDYDGIRAALRWAIDDNWTLDTTFMYQNLDVDGFGDVDLNQQAYAGRNFGSADQIRFGPDTWEDDWYQFSMTLEGNTRFGDLLVTASYFDREVEYHADAATYQFFFNQLSDYYGSTYYFYDFGGDGRLRHGGCTELADDQTVRPTPHRNGGLARQASGRDQRNPRRCSSRRRPGQVNHGR